jgi:hypothetical protein
VRINARPEMMLNDSDQRQVQAVLSFSGAVVERVVAARSESDANTTAFPRERHSRMMVFVDQVRKYGDAKAVLEWSDRCAISKIETLSPGVGAASRLLGYLKLLSGRYRIALFGNATAYVTNSFAFADQLLAQQRLEQWYRNHCFILHKNKLGMVELWYPERS